jgi:hypothetical protein
MQQAKMLKIKINGWLALGSRKMSPKPHDWVAIPQTRSSPSYSVSHGLDLCQLLFSAGVCWPVTIVRNWAKMSKNKTLFFTGGEAMGVSSLY